METLNQLFFDLGGAFFGWLAFTVIMLRLHKDGNEATWNWGSYKKENWDNWLASLVMIPVLIWVGYAKLDIKSVGLEFEWSSFYYLGSGFAPELVIMLWNKMRSNGKTS